MTWATKMAKEKKVADDNQLADNTDEVFNNPVNPADWMIY
jgi:hypothetical protein